ncbi:MAG TPA: DUF2442 domain-containing protein, partial [Longimicrobiaceae bacterium]|nr:DUF2442 domain-containing protein [Longimicrobiaceae bacterium]
MARSWKPATDAEIERQYAEAVEAGRAAEVAGPRAASARYDRGTGRVEVELRNGCLFAFPAEMGQGLRGASPEELAAVEVTPGGYGLHWEALDADLAVPALMAGVFGTEAWMRELGRAGGRSTRDATAAAAREKGRRGGRPRKDAGEGTPTRRVAERKAEYGA